MLSLKGQDAGLELTNLNKEAATNKARYGFWRIDFGFDFSSILRFKHFGKLFTCLGILHFGKEIMFSWTTLA
jgi:hypothetical protein